MRQLRTPIIALAALSAALGVAACGGGDEEGASTAPAEGAAAPAETTKAPAGKPVDTVDVSETEYELDPTDGQVSESGVIEFVAANDGSIEHSLEVEGPDGEAVTPTIAPGESASVKVDLAPGQYTWYCPIANHRELGMEGTVTVAGGSGGSADTGSSDTGAGEPSGGAGY